MRSPRREPTASPASCEPRLCGQIRPSASACSSTRVDAAGARDVGRLALDLAANEPHDRLRRLVLRPHQRERLLLAPVAPPGLVDPVGVGVLERALGERRRAARGARRSAAASPRS